MSTQERKGDSSLNNLPETNAAKSATSGNLGGSSGVGGKSQEGSILTDTDNINTQPNAPIDKHGDTWGGGVSYVNKQCK